MPQNVLQFISQRDKAQADSRINVNQNIYITILMLVTS